MKMGPHLIHSIVLKIEKVPHYETIRHKNQFYLILIQAVNAFNCPLHNIITFWAMALCVCGC